MSATSDSSPPSSSSSDHPSNANAGCVGVNDPAAGTAASCAGCPNQSICSTRDKTAVDPAIAEIRNRLAGVKHKILVLSGKGGVGKSTMSVSLARRLALSGASVGILDIDICGPSMARMCGVEGEEIKQSNFGWSPVYTDDDSLAVMSVALMINSRNDAIIWRGPRKTGLIKEFLTGVYWGDELDFLIIDAPPGTSDEHLAISSFLKESGIDGALIVTTAQEMSLLDVRKEINFCQKVGIPILGVVENMSGFICPHCSNCSEIFPALTGGAKKMCEELSVPMLGRVPIDPLLLRACEEGKNYWKQYPNGTARKPLTDVIVQLLQANDALKETYQSIINNNPNAFQ